MYCTVKKCQSRLRLRDSNDQMGFREEVIIRDPSETPNCKHIGDPNNSSETPIFSSETPTFSSETPIFSSETPVFSWCVVYWPPCSMRVPSRRPRGQSSDRGGRRAGRRTPARTQTAAQPTIAACAYIHTCNPCALVSNDRKLVFD